jgi:heat shock protein HslJ/membrane-bound inhibitor of C-type lysozyme
MGPIHSAALLGIMVTTQLTGQAQSKDKTLAGTSWQLVRFEGGDDTILTPDDGSKYTLEFGADGALTARIDCNRGRGTWKSSGPNQLEFGPLALTRARCLPPSMHDQIVRQLPNIRSYVLRDGHLFLALKIDGGIYEFAPQSAGQTSLTSPVASKGPFDWTCTTGGDTLRVTFYSTQPGMALLERGGVTRAAFQVKAASGSKYEGEGVMFWEARGEAMLNWMGSETTCKRK